jgi:hypothetical protein
MRIFPDQVSERLELKNRLQLIIDDELPENE